MNLKILSLFLLVFVGVFSIVGLKNIHAQEKENSKRCIGPARKLVSSKPNKRSASKPAPKKAPQTPKVSPADSKEVVESLLDEYQSWSDLPQLSRGEVRKISAAAREDLKLMRNFSKGFNLTIHWFEFKDQKYIFVNCGNDGGAGASLYSPDGKKVIASQTISESGAFTTEEMLQGGS
ncbi:MAG: hypothetical protein J0L93_05815 [Deltaproteobacteria bacterium]|nr:hypothetical protein [Deltaproteobacteria bacterium]